MFGYILWIHIWVYWLISLKISLIAISKVDKMIFFLVSEHKMRVHNTIIRNASKCVQLKKKQTTVNLPLVIPWEFDNVHMITIITEIFIRLITAIASSYCSLPLAM